MTTTVEATSEMTRNKAIQGIGQSVGRKARRAGPRPSSARHKFISLQELAEFKTEALAHFAEYEAETNKEIEMYVKAMYFS